MQLVDYVIGSPYLLSSTKRFVVNDFDAIFSDKHSIIEFELHEQHDRSKEPGHSENHIVQEGEAKFKESSKVIWKPEEKVDYVNNIDRQKIDVLLKTSNTLSVKGLTQQLNNILLEPATRITVGKTGLVKKRACKYIKYSKASKLMRREYHRAKHENNIHKNAETKQSLRTKSKDYKKEVKKVIRESKAAVIQKLRNLKS